MRAKRVRSERGSAVVLVAVSLTVILGMGALAVDLGMLMKAHNDAQRTADAAALAGAAAYLAHANPVDARDDAIHQALQYSALNYVGGTYVDTTKVDSTVAGTRTTMLTNESVVVFIPDSSKVRVVIRRPAIGLFFARILNFTTATVSAKAAAIALNSGGAKCVKPFALPDMWRDVDNDVNGNHLWDPTETWNFDPTKGDTYRPFQGPDSVFGGLDTTGYNSRFRDPPYGDPANPFEQDQGRQIVIKPQNPNNGFVIQPGIFYPWDMPDDTTMTNCGVGGGGGNSGAADYSNNICACNNNVVQLNTDYPIKTGNMVGPTRFGVNDLIALDPGARWNQSLNGGAGGVENWNQQLYGSDWHDSPRVIKIALWDPAEIAKSGHQYIKFNNFALFFVEGLNNSTAQVTGRFISYAQGSGNPGPGGPLTKIIRLVE